MLDKIINLNIKKVTCFLFSNLVPHSQHSHTLPGVPTN